MREQILRAPLLDDPAEIHHRDLVAEIIHHREIVADQDVAQPELILQVLQKIEHLRLHGDVECADRLVGDNQFWLGDQRTRDRDALALAAGEFMRELVHVGVAQPDLPQHAGNALTQRGAIHASERGQRLRDDTRNGLSRVQRAIGILKHHLEITPGAAQLVSRHPVQVTAHQRHRPRRRLFQRHHQPREGRLARSGLADHAEASACHHLRGDAVERMHLPGRLEHAFARQRVALRQILHVEQRQFGGW